MTYAVKEIFSTIQGEGYHAGRASIFVRFAGCNLWSGHEEDRERDATRNEAECPRWCDTDFVGRDRMDAHEIVSRIIDLSAGHSRDMHVVFTGGEPMLQLSRDAEVLSMVTARLGIRPAIETNGTILPSGDVSRADPWITLSPKVPRRRILVSYADELKLVFPAYSPEDWETFPAQHRFIQAVDPLLTINRSAMRSISELTAASYVRRHPRWRLSLQTHKHLGLP